MPLFYCTKCLCIENTATGHYWRATPNQLCSECHTGTWHGRFPKESAIGYFADSSGLIRHPNNLSFTGKKITCTLITEGIINKGT